MDTPAQLVNGRTLVPVRAVSESFGVEVGWDDATKTVTLRDKNVLQTIEYSDGTIFGGEVVEGKPYGYGTQYFISDNSEKIATGLWDEMGLKLGYVSEKNPDGSEFAGQIVDGLQNGYGESLFANGDCYKGNYVNGKKEGYGEYYWTDGDCYKGNCVNNLPDGYGEFYYANGDYYKGYYQNGERHGQGTLYEAGITYSGEFENGKYVQTYSASLPSAVVPEVGNNLKMTLFRNAKFPLYLYSNDGKTYLGKLTTNKYDSESIFNEYGTYGSKYNTKSIWNEFGTYGSKYNVQSAFNEYTNTPPVIVDSNFNVIGYLTANKYKSGGVSVLELMQILTTLNK